MKLDALKILILTVIGLYGLNVHAQFRFDQAEIAWMTGSNIPNRYESFNWGLQVFLMQKDWLGIGIGFGSSESKNFVDIEDESRIQLLDKEIAENSVFFEILPRVSPKIYQISKVPVYFEVTPSVRLTTRYKLKYGYITSEGHPLIGKYVSPPAVFNGRIGLGFKFGSMVHFGVGYALSNGSGGKLSAKWKSDAHPKFKRNISHGLYLSIGIIFPLVKNK